MDLRRLPNGTKASPASSSGPNRTPFSINSLLSHKQQEQNNSAWLSGNTRSSFDNSQAFPFPAMPLFGPQAFPQILAGMPLPNAGSIHPALLFNAMAMAGAPIPPLMTARPKRPSLESIFHRRQPKPHHHKSASSDEERDEPPRLQRSSPHSDGTGARAEFGDRQESKMMDLARRAKSASPNTPPPKSPHSPASSVVSSDSSSISVKNEPTEADLAAKAVKKDRSKEAPTEQIDSALVMQEQQQQQWLASMNHYVHLANQMLAQQQGLGQPFGTGPAAAIGMGIPGASANNGERRPNPVLQNGANGAWDQRFAPPWLFGHQSAVHHSQQQLQPFAHLVQMHHPHHHHHHKGGQQKRKGGQIRFTNEQTDTLESTFDAHKYLTNSQRKKLAKSLALSERQVKTWFQNRRAKWRRIRKDGEDEEDLSIHGGFHHHHHPPVLADANPQLPLSAVAAHSLHQAITNNVTAVEHQHQHRPPYSASISQLTRNATGINNHQSAAVASATAANSFRNFFSPS